MTSASEQHDGDARLIDDALAGGRAAIGQLISLFEDVRLTAHQRRDAALAKLTAKTTRNAVFIGITGTPGSGKSSLVSRLIRDFRQQRPNVSLAVLAIDPSSPLSGGALLGDRTRLGSDAAGVFFRSQASQTALGGLGRGTFQTCRVLARLFDVVLIETVGIGQGEVDIRYLADRVYLVLQPLGGDELQFLKAGIMEVPDVVVLNKCDQKRAALASYHALLATVGYARHGVRDGALPVFQTSALTGHGVAELSANMAEVVATDFAPKAAYFFAREVKRLWGERGIERLDLNGGAETWLARACGYGKALEAFRADIERR